MNTERTMSVAVIRPRYAAKPFLAGGIPDLRAKSLTQSAPAGAGGTSKNRKNGVKKKIVKGRRSERKMRLSSTDILSREHIAWGGTQSAANLQQHQSKLNT